MAIKRTRRSKRVRPTTAARRRRDRTKARGARPAGGARLLTRRQLADVLDVHMQTVTKWERNGMPVAERGARGRPSRYNEAAVRAWREQRKESAQQTPLNFSLERAKKEKWQALLAEQTYRVRSRLLLPAAEVERALAADYAAVRAVLLASYTSRCDLVFRAATRDGLAGVERELKAIAYETLRQLTQADRDPDDAPPPADGGLGSGGGEDDSADPEPVDLPGTVSA